jgi:hypothetical protein
MKSKETIEELISQYEFDYKITKDYCHESEIKLAQLKAKIAILKWILGDD